MRLKYRMIRMGLGKRYPVIALSWSVQVSTDGQRIMECVDLGRTSSLLIITTATSNSFRHQKHSFQLDIAVRLENVMILIVVDRVFDLEIIVSPGRLRDLSRGLYCSKMLLS